MLTKHAWVLGLVLASQTASAFVSYEEPKPLPAAPASSEPALTPLAEDVDKTDKTDEMIEAYKAKSAATIAGRSCPSGVIHIGKIVPGEPTHFRGNGGITQAAHAMAPKGWHVNIRSLPDKATMWDIKSEWYFALGIAARDVGGCVQLDWNRHSVSISKNSVTGKLAKSKKAATDEALEELSKPFVPRVETPAAASATGAEPAQPVLESWTLDPNKTLRENLLEWSGKANWKLVWNVKNTDFRVTQSATLVGPFLTAIEQVMEAYHYSNNPLAVNLFEANHVIEIVDFIPFQRNTLN